MKKIILSLLAAANTFSLTADEGMWLLPQIKQHRLELMNKAGLRASEGLITDTLSQAIILFNGNGTASFISKDGLVLTNYHCARTGIQQASSKEHNYLRNGFWASGFSSEIPLRGITMSINVVVKDVSEEVNRQLSKIKNNRKEQYAATCRIADSYAKRYPGTKASIRSYRGNSIHVLYVTKTFRDVRLVGAPPISIAKFGGETDNWMWPRHGCDFALLRAYVSKDGKTTPYSKDNVPYHPTHFLHVSAKGVSEGDYTMSMGYPGFTNRGATSAQIWETRNVINPPIVKLRTERMELLQRMMRDDESTNIKYAEKFASSANYCKNYTGMNEWIDRIDLIRKKADKELAFVNSCTDNSLRLLYAETIRIARKGVEDAARYRRALGYLQETFNEACDMMRFASFFSGAMKSMDKKNFTTNVDMFYKNYIEQVDQEVTKRLLKIVVADLDRDLLPPSLAALKDHEEKEIDNFVDKLYGNTSFSSRDKVMSAFNNPSFRLNDDAAYVLNCEIKKKEKEISINAEQARKDAHSAIVKLETAMRSYDNANFYPDADKTLRLSYGNVCPINFDDIVKPWQTSMAGLMKKASSDNPDYAIPDRLRQMWQQKDFGDYAIGSDLPTCFITNGDVTGGNSGSPMLNANGEVVGLVFDCNWESMLRDFEFNPDLHRVICLDMRYLLFIVDKYAGMKNIIEEILPQQ